MGNFPATGLYALKVDMDIPIHIPLCTNQLLVVLQYRHRQVF